MTEQPTSGPAAEGPSAREPDEEPLVGDGVTAGIVRIGDTVRRPVRPFSATVQAYLAHLHRAGFAGAPVPLGTDEQGREILSFVPGDVPREPLPPDTAGEDVLIALARLIRALHEASQGWTPPPDAVWGGLPGAVAVAVAPAGVGGAGGRLDEAAPELVSHRDYCPGNVVFRDGLPAALIDFDLARPTTRVYDIANALYWWAPLLDPRDRAPAFVAADVSARVAVFADSYGMTPAQRRGLVPLAVTMIERFHRSFRAAAQADPVFRRLWYEGGRERMPRAETWIRRTAPAITARIAPGAGAPRSGALGSG